MSIIQFKNSSRIKIFTLLFLLLSLIVTFLIGETFCRIMGLGKPNPALSGPKQLYVPDPNPKVSFHLRAGYEDYVYGANVKVNSQGLRDNLIPYERTPDTKRILILGDSVAFGFGVEMEETFAQQWEDWLNRQPGQSWEIVNSGVPAYTAVQEINWFASEGVRYRPDAIVISYVMNDPEPIYPLGPDGKLQHTDLDEYLGKIASHIPKPLLPLTERLHLLKTLNRILLHANPEWKEVHNELSRFYNETVFTFPSWQETQSEWQRLKAYCDEQGVFLLAAIYPTMYRLHSREDHPFAPHYQKIQDALAGMQIPCILTLDNYIGQSVNTMRAYEDDPHPSAASHRIFAQRLHRELKDRWKDYTVSSDWTP